MIVMPGVELQQDATGTPTHVAIDLREHPEAIPLLKNAGLMPKSKQELQDAFDSGLTVKEVFDGVRELIKDHYANRNNNPASKG